MKICPNCKTEIKNKNGNTHIPFTNNGKLLDGNRICAKCWLTLDKINRDVAHNSKKYSLAQIQEFLAEKNEKDKNIEAQLLAIGIDSNSSMWGRKEYQALPDILSKDEEIKAVILGRYNNGTGILVATNKRLVFVDKGLLYGLKTEDFGLDKISSIQFESGMLLADVKIMASGNISKIENVDKIKGRSFVDITRQLLSTPKQINEPVTKVDYIEQLERLAKLKENGIITQEEFDNQKFKILNS